MRKSERIAVVVNLDWTMKHHQEVFSGTQDYASKQGWQSVLHRSRWLQSGLREVGPKHGIKLASLLVLPAFSDSIRS